jgi:hypothetical protein
MVLATLLTFLALKDRGYVLCRMLHPNFGESPLHALR